MKNKILVLLITVIVFSTLLGCILYKEPISEATYTDLYEIEGIGEVLSERVVSFIDANPDADIEDLKAIQGIGPERLKLIRKEFK